PVHPGCSLLADGEHPVREHCVPVDRGRGSLRRLSRARRRHESHGVLAFGSGRFGHGGRGRLSWILGTDWAASLGVTLYANRKICLQPSAFSLSTLSAQTSTFRFSSARSRGLAATPLALSHPRNESLRQG